MQRSDLASTVLQLKSLGIDNIMSFEWLAPPPAEVCATVWGGWGVLLSLEWVPLPCQDV